MESGRSSFARRDRAYLSVLALVFSFMCGLGARAQQKPVDSSPAAVPVQPASALAIEEVGSKSDSRGSGSASTLPNSDTQKSDNSGVARVADSSLVKLGAGDLVEVSVYNVPELSAKARVSNSGDVYLPLIDYVHVGDLTIEEAQSLIAKRLADGGFVRSPHVTIFVDESSSQGVTVLGEVSKPGIYPNLGDHKLYEIVSEAGGFTQSAAKRVSIIRRNQPQPLNVALPKNLADDLSSNVDIMPGDTINVPRAPVIYVVGDVGRPSGLLVDNGSLTVLQALALAGGTNRTAKMGGVRIIRKGPTGMTETQVPLKKMLEAKAPDIPLQGDDILFIPVSGGRLMAARTLEAAMSMATSVSIYAVHP
jgi:polysaccharide export outer membrane protein